MATLSYTATVEELETRAGRPLTGAERVAVSMLPYRRQYPRLALLEQVDWWITRDGWEQYVTAWHATDELTITEDHGLKLATPRTVRVRRWWNVADVIDAVDAEHRIRVDDMTVGHRHAVLALLTRKIPAMHAAAGFRVVDGIGDADDGICNILGDEADQIMRTAPIDWFNSRPLVARMREANLAAKTRPSVIMLDGGR